MSAAVSVPVAPFRLTDAHQSHLKFSGREPHTLAELAQARAEYTHRCRIAEIKALSKKLALLDVLLPALAEQGQRLHWRDMTGADQCKVVRIFPSVFTDDSALLKALLAVGFREVAREPWGSYEKVTLKHGRSLLVAIDVKKAESTEPSIATAGVPS